MSKNIHSERVQISPPIVHIVQRLQPGGLEVLVLDLVQSLQGRHIIISLEGTEPALRAAWPRLAMFDIAAFDKSEGFRPLLGLRLAGFLKRLQPHAVMTHHIGPLLYGGFAARLAGVSHLIHVEHDVWHYESVHRLQLARKLMALVRPQLVAISPQIFTRLRELFPTRAVQLIQNGVDTVRFNPAGRETARSRLNLSGMVIGSAGRLEEVKGHDILLEAFARLYGAPTLVIVGDGSKRAALEAQARSLNIADRVRFLGHCDDLANIYPAFDVFCLPSRQEGLPLAVLEAQACGLPVVASNVGGVASALCASSGISVPPENPQALSAALQTMLSHPPRHDPRAFVAENFGWAKTLQLYRQMIGV